MYFAINNAVTKCNVVTSPSPHRIEGLARAKITENIPKIFSELEIVYLYLMVHGALQLILRFLLARNVIHQVLD